MSKPETPKIKATITSIPSPDAEVSTDGRYHLVKVNDQGEEIGRPFTISPQGYDRTYRSLPNYKVKKSPLTK